MEESKPRLKPAERCMYGLLGVMFVGLLIMRPSSLSSVTGTDVGTAGCLDNLQKIAVAYALYARDFDGKIPRGIDPEDRFNAEIWDRSGAYDGMYFKATQYTPFLHEILRPYVSAPTVFQCPDDDGWGTSRLPLLAESRLRNIKPSSYKKFGTSYYCFTKYGFTGQTTADIDEPAAALILFDGDLWHGNPRKSMNGMFADGHVANLSAAQFQRYARD